MAAPRMVKSLQTFREQVNKLAPKRSKASDGWVGDKAHSMRKSDHNPEPDGTVDAFDLTHDPKNGVDIQKVCDALIASKDKRISYLICNGMIISGAGGTKPWVKRAYTGANKHTKHLHVSVKDAGQDDTTPWKIDSAFGKAAPAPKPAPAPTPAPKPDVYASKTMIKLVQAKLTELGYPLGSKDVATGEFDGVLGTLTKSSIRDFRADNGLPEGEHVDAALVTALETAKPRKLAPAREEATPGKVRESVPEARTSWLTKIGAFFTGIVSLIGAFFNGILGNIAPAGGYVTQIKDAVGDMPAWVWFLAIAVIAAALFLLARHGEKKSVEAFREGARL